LIQSCPIPVIIAGGKKRRKWKALELAHNAVKPAPSASTWAAIFSSPIAGRHDQAVTGDRSRKRLGEGSLQIYESEKAGMARKSIVNGMFSD